MKKFCTFISYFVFLMDFYCDVVKRNVHVWLGCTKMRNAGIDTVLHWRLPDVHIFDTDPSLICKHENEKLLDGYKKYIIHGSYYHIL